MCDSFWQEYAAFVNNPSANGDPVPEIILFNQTNCTGTFVPNTANAFNTQAQNKTSLVTTPTRTYTTNTTAQSLFVPFNAGTVTLTFSDGGTMKVMAPTTMADTSLVKRPDGVTVNAHPITQIALQGEIWNDRVIEMCKGAQGFIGAFKLEAYGPNTEACDTFMTSYCANPLNLPKDVCSCFRELPALQQKSQQIGVDLPVTCFGSGDSTAEGTKCAQGLGYRTLNMLSLPCNLTICEQVVKEHGGVILDQSTNTIFCGGQYFQRAGTVVQPQVSIPPTTGNAVTTSSTPYYVWIMFGVAAVLFGLLMFLMFAPTPKKTSSVVQQIERWKLRSGK